MNKFTFFNDAPVFVVFLCCVSLCMCVCVCVWGGGGGGGGRMQKRMCVCVGVHVCMCDIVRSVLIIMLMLCNNTCRDASVQNHF